MKNLENITAKEFIKRLNDFGLVENAIVKGNVKINKLKNKLTDFNVKNVEFINDVNLITNNKNLVLIFHTVIFKKKFLVTQANILDLRILFCSLNSFTLSHITNSKFSLQILSSSIIEFLCDSCKINKLTINQKEIRYFNFWGECTIENIDIQSLTISEKIEISELQSETFSIINSNFRKGVDLTNISVSREFSIIDTLIENSSNFNVCRINDLIIESCKINDLKLIISGYIEKRNEYNKIDIYNTRFENEFVIEELDNPLNLITCKKIIIKFGPRSFGDFKLSNLNIDYCSLSGNNYNSSITINESKITLFDFDQFSNYKSINIFNLMPFSQDSEFIIKNSNLGNTNLYYCNLSEYRKVSINQSNLMDISAIGVNWFKDKALFKEVEKNKKGFIIRIIHSFILAFINRTNDDKDVIAFNNLRELYRQLKMAMEKQSNKIQTIEFKKNEMKAYKQELKLTKRFYSQERFILWINQSNNYGQNWIKPILLGILFTVLFFYLVFLHSSTMIPCEPSILIQRTFEIFKHNYQHIPSFLYPTFNLKDILKMEDIPFGSNFWALIQRISISFFIYQTIIAFRKYSNK